eukprot:COSAG01_NODE_2964_length_6791_cov_2.291542_5_plen_100_part_00
MRSEGCHATLLLPIRGSRCLSCVAVLLPNRRDMRRQIQELFEEMDTDKSGILDKDEFGKLIIRTTRDKNLPSIINERGGVASTHDGEPAVSILESAHID